MLNGLNSPKSFSNRRLVMGGAAAAFPLSILLDEEDGFDLSF